MRPVPHSDDLPVPTPTVNKDLLPLSDEEMLSEEGSAKSISSEDKVSVYSGASDNEPHWITQEDLNDLARDLYLSKQHSELLASRLEQWNLVKADVRVTSDRTRNKDFASFFDMENSVSIAYSVYLKESYDNIELLLEAVKYNQYQWNLCGNFKVIGHPQSTDAFSFYGTVGLYPSTTNRTGTFQIWRKQFSRKSSGGDEVYVPSSSLHQAWSWTKMALPSNTCALCSQLSVLLSSRRASSSDLRYERCSRMTLRSFLP
ncbi:hypothetical protein FHG87_002689 [Trinorchestia longiramus]|nr:hypothetical protein FHG87_002689 [Trinorchestia longiramus]